MLEIDYGYIIAGGRTLVGETKSQVKLFDDYDPFEVMDKLKIKSLTSFGEPIAKNGSKAKLGETYIKKFLDFTQHVTKENKVDNFVVDSGGYQCAVGKIPPARIPEFIDTYYTYLKDHNEKFDSAFSLDLPPSDNIFSSEKDLLNKNMDSYQKIFSLPEEVRKKIIFVYHFRTPMVHRIWENLLKDQTLVSKFNSNRWAIGGVVTGLKGEGAIPIITISLPITRIVHFELMRGNKNINIHILGGCAYRDILYYEFIRAVALKEFGVEINFTFDSSGLFRMVCMGRRLDIMDKKGYIRGYSLRSGSTNYQDFKIVRDEMNELLDWAGVDYKYTKDTLYDDDNARFDPRAKPLLYLCYPYFYYKLQKHCREFVSEIIDDYLAGNIIKIDGSLRKKLSQINSSMVVSKRFILKSESFLKSIDFFREMNIKKVESYINTYLSQDEFKMKTSLPSF